MLSSRQIVNGFIKRGYIQPEQINDALNCTEISPTINSWFKFIDRLLLCLGALCVGFSVLFFIAYNWNAWGRFGKFALLESLLAAIIIFYWRAEKNSFKAQISLLLGCLMVGILMAFFGQTYQTGADPWTLFFFWALLITPWVVINRFAPLWLSWLALLNVSLSLYIDSFSLPFNLYLYLSSEKNIWFATFLLNSIALIALELNSQRFTYLSPRWLARIIASAAGFMITLLLIETAYHNYVQPLLCWGIFMISLYIVYRHLRCDLFMLTGGCLSGIIIIVTFSIKHLDQDFLGGFALLIALLIIGLISLATIWLKKVNKEMLP